MSINSEECMKNPYCKANIVRKIDRKICINNCKMWNYWGKKDCNGNDKMSCKFKYK